MFRLLFYTPRIAPNTGNAIRTAAATGAELHLVEPLGFSLADKHVRRAGRNLMVVQRREDVLRVAAIDAFAVAVASVSSTTARPFEARRADVP